MAAVSGTLLAVCSCTVLPLFVGIYKRGAGLGAAIAFLYSGPAINIMAIVLTAKVLGPELGIARAVGAIVFAVVIGAIMHLIYRKEESARALASARGFEAGEQEKPLGVVVAFFALMVGILVFANWAAADSPAWMKIYQWKWPITSLLAILFGGLLVIRWNWPARSLLGSGMGKGPALALLLAGPALSLPNMLVIRSILGTGKTVVYSTLVVVMATVTGFIYGNYW